MTKSDLGVWPYRGVRQGDPLGLGPLLFGIAIHPILIRTEDGSGETDHSASLRCGPDVGDRASSLSACVTVETNSKGTATRN
jgi:hypothetical protein